MLKEKAGALAGQIWEALNGTEGLTQKQIKKLAKMKADKDFFRLTSLDSHALRKLSNSLTLLIHKLQLYDTPKWHICTILNCNICTI